MRLSGKIAKSTSGKFSAAGGSQRKTIMTNLQLKRGFPILRAAKAFGIIGGQLWVQLGTTAVVNRITLVPREEPAFAADDSQARTQRQVYFLGSNDNKDRKSKCSLTHTGPTPASFIPEELTAIASTREKKLPENPTGQIPLISGEERTGEKLAL